jgi:cytidylate kinase
MREKPGKRLVITVDGPAGVGKSTVSRELAKRMSYTYLDTGALYRAVAYKIRQCGLPLENNGKIFELCEKTEISCETVNENMKIFVDREDVTDKIRTEEVGLLASKASALSMVRKALLPVQRDAGKMGGIVAEGRDMGTVVFPDADVKFFLSADVKERTKRRHDQLVEKGISCDYDEIQRRLEKRDCQDTERNISPLKPAVDAIIIDTTHIGIGTVVEEMMKGVAKKITFSNLR